MSDHKISSPGGRLLAAAELVRQGAVLADIGTDHAYLPLFLFRSGRISSAYLTDVHRGPLDRAEETMREAGLTDRVQFRLADGAASLADSGATDYAICGMGGELIASIVASAPQLRDTGVHLILQPMTRPAALRHTLAREGFGILKEVFAIDTGRAYVTLLAAYTGEARQLSEGEATFGDALRQYAACPAARAYADPLIAAVRKRMAGREAGALDTEAERALLDFVEKNINSGKGTDR